MSGLSATDAERQTADSAANYLNRALRMFAERCNLETSLERDPAGFAVQFAPVLAALIEAQAREYQSWVIFDRLGNLDDSLFYGLGILAERWEDQNLFRFRQELKLPTDVAERRERMAGDGD
jgi:hypothetical protein